MPSDDELTTRNVRLPPAMWAAVEVLAKANQRTVAAEIRAAIVHHAARYGITVEDTVQHRKRTERWPFT